MISDIEAEKVLFQNFERSIHSVREHQNFKIVRLAVQEMRLLLRQHMRRMAQ